MQIWLMMVSRKFFSLICRKELDDLKEYFDYDSIDCGMIIFLKKNAK